MGGIRRPVEELKDTQINHLILRSAFVTASGHRWWNCDCVCGEKVTKREDSILRGAVRSCGCKHPRRRRGAANKGWKGCGDIDGVYFCQTKIGAKNRKHEFSITLEYMWELFLTQDRRCAITGEPLVFFGSKDRATGANQTASLDRIDSAKGYVEGNVWWVHKDVNRMKSDIPLDRFIEICRLVAERHAKSNSQVALTVA